MWKTWTDPNTNYLENEFSIHFLGHGIQAPSSLRPHILLFMLEIAEELRWVGGVYIRMWNWHQPTRPISFLQMRRIQVMLQREWNFSKEIKFPNSAGSIKFPLNRFVAQKLQLWWYFPVAVDKCILIDNWSVSCADIKSQQHFIISIHSFPPFATSYTILINHSVGHENSYFIQTHSAFCRCRSTSYQRMENI